MARDPGSPAAEVLVPEEPVPAHLLRDWHLATWLRTFSLKVEGDMDDVLEVLRDELTAVHCAAIPCTKSEGKWSRQGIRVPFASF